MKYKIFKVWESASSDGYNHVGDKIYLSSKEEADFISKQKHGNYTTVALEHDVIDVDDKIFILSSTVPIKIKKVTLEKEIAEIEKINKISAAMSKLSKNEIELLGLSDYETT